MPPGTYCVTVSSLPPSFLSPLISSPSLTPLRFKCVEHFQTHITSQWIFGQTPAQFDNTTKTQGERKKKKKEKKKEKKKRKIHKEKIEETKTNKQTKNNNNNNQKEHTNEHHHQRSRKIISKFKTSAKTSKTEKQPEKKTYMNLQCCCKLYEREREKDYLLRKA